MGEMLSIEYLQRMRKGVEQDDYKFHQQGILNLIDSHIEANTVMLAAEEKLVEERGKTPTMKYVGSVDLVSHGQLVNRIITRMEEFGWAGEPRLLEFANVLATELSLSQEKPPSPGYVDGVALEDIDESVRHLYQSGYPNKSLWKKWQKQWRETANLPDKPSPQAEYQAIIEKAEKLKDTNKIYGGVNTGAVIDLIVRLATLVGGHQHAYIWPHETAAHRTTKPVG
jgi:hypothetical protein